MWPWVFESHIESVSCIFIYFKSAWLWIRLNWFAQNYFNTGEISLERFSVFVFFCPKLFSYLSYSLSVSVCQYYVCGVNFHNNKPTLKRKLLFFCPIFYAFRKIYGMLPIRKFLKRSLISLPHQCLQRRIILHFNFWGSLLRLITMYRQMVWFCRRTQSRI